MSFDHVTLIVDKNFGERAADQALRGPIWVVRSAVNEMAMRKLWSTARFAGDHLTIFDDSKRASEDMVIGMLDTVDMHHHGWLTFEVIAVESSLEIEQAFRDYGVGTISPTGSGFVYQREKTSR